MSDLVRLDRPPRRHVPTAAGRRLPPQMGDRPVVLTLHRDADRPVAADVVRPVPAVAPAPAAAPKVEAPMTEGALAARFFPVMLAVVAADLLTKAWAVATLAAGSISLGPWLSLSLAFNRASAGGVSLGEHTRAVNFGATGIVVGLVIMLVPTLASADRRAWRALALIAGAGLGNMASLLSARGVPDFIAIHRTTGAWVLNVADVALLVGLVLLATTTRRIWRNRASAKPRPVAPAPAVAARSIPGPVRLHLS